MTLVSNYAGVRLKSPLTAVQEASQYSRRVMSRAAIVDWGKLGRAQSALDPEKMHQQRNFWIGG